MEVIRARNFSHTRSGHRRALAPGEAVPFAYRVTGGRVATVSAGDRRYTPAERAAGRATVREATFTPPIEIAHDVIFLGCNFAQRLPHTPLFVVAPGVRVCFGDPTPQGQREANLGICNLVNVTLPDGVEVYGGNPAQLEYVVTENPDLPLVSLLHDCPKCHVVRPIIQEILEFGNRGAFRDQYGRWLHHELKPHYRARRLDPDASRGHANQIRAENAIAMQAALAYRAERDQ